MNLNIHHHSVQPKLIQFVCLFLLFAFSQTASSQQKVPGQSYFGTNNYTEYIYGSLPVIIGAPHDGTLTPSNIPDRNDTTCGTAITTARDLNAKRIARSLDTSLNLLVGGHPHTIICLLHRKKVDVNRDLSTAACGDTTAEKVWNDYMDFMDTAHRTVMNNFGRGLFLDLHGHGHPLNRIEIGYLLYGSTLRKSDSVLNTTNIINASSIHYLANNNLTGQTHAQLIRGANAFGTMLGNAGYPSVPSQQIPYPDSADAYFDGGYNTARWGSRDNGTIDGMQLETYYTGLRDNWQDIRRFTDSLAVIIKKYLCNIFACSTLPVTLLDFAAQRRHQGVELTWRTIHEMNLVRYVVERSENGEAFNEIGKVNVSGQFAVSSKQYRYIDVRLPTVNRQMFYRLKMVDNDGSFSYSKIASVQLSVNSASQVAVYPNPVKDDFTVSHSKAGRGAFIQLFTTTGVLLQTIAVKERSTETAVHFFTPQACNCMLLYRDGNNIANSFLLKQ